MSISSSTSPGDVYKIAPASEPGGYTKLYREIYRIARQRGLLIYANVLLPVNGTHVFEYHIPEWVAVVSAYGNYFCPDFLGPFGETGAPYPSAYSVIVDGVRRNLTPKCTDPFVNSRPAPLIEGPDAAWFEQTVAILNQNPGLARKLDIIGSHANVRERSAITRDWIGLYKRFRKPLWDSEAESFWSFVSDRGPHEGQEVGVKSVLASNVVSGIVIYDAPHFLQEQNVNGTITYTLAGIGVDMATGLHEAGWPVPSLDHGVRISTSRRSPAAARRGATSKKSP
jgi:hypothetical protein